eukprot:CAMPEP_0167809242 /NCGR_PEP_ID=MMETSP0111_2-20121227/23676_1 /TAXON_ID=91324 /ORGANISM="Lotharella globosa, Strain CCCM811" /LENGTH=37 /DNA_ID= /DNA_START= /DNA_END= /DNA_ORIENTATION=
MADDMNDYCTSLQGVFMELTEFDAWKPSSAFSSSFIK